MKPKSHYALALALIIVGVVVALSATPAIADTSTTPTKTARIKAAGLSLEYPSSWTVIELTKKDSAAQQKILEKANPKLAQAVAETRAKVSTSAKFHAVNLNAADQFASNVNVGVVPHAGFPSSLAEFESAVKPAFEKAGGTVINTSAVGGKSGYRIEVNLPFKLPDGTQAVSRVGELAIPHGDDLVVVVVAAGNDEPGAVLIDNVLRSVHKI